MKKKKVFASVLASALVLGSLTLPENISFGGLNFGTLFVQAADVVDSGTCGDDLTWTLDNTGTLTISGTGAMNIEFSSVSDIPWYSSCDDIKSVIIKSGVTSIYRYAFYNFDSLTNITISDSVTSIGTYAFSNCDSLTSVKLPNGLTTIEDSTFRDCSSLESVEISNNITAIGASAFEGCNNMTSIVIPDSVTEIGSAAFRDCRALTSIQLSNNLNHIEKYTFGRCTSLKNIKLPDNVVTIENFAFGDCRALANIEMSDTTASNIDKYVFYNHIDISTLYFSCDALVDENGFLIINDILYSYVGDDTTIEIPNNVKSICSYAFDDSNNIAEIYIPCSITYIGDEAFSSCAELSDVYYSSDEDDWDKISIGTENEYLTSANIHFTGKTYEIGDINEDGYVDYLDAMLVLRYDAELDTLTDEQLALADVNSDGSVDSLDAILILRYDAGLIDEF